MADIEAKISNLWWRPAGALAIG